MYNNTVQHRLGAYPPRCLPRYLYVCSCLPTHSLSRERVACRNRATRGQLRARSEISDACARLLLSCRPCMTFLLQPSGLTHLPLLGGRVQRENVVATQKNASDPGGPYALCHVLNVLDASQRFQPSEHLVPIHSAPFHASNLLISGASFPTRARYIPTSISSPLVPCICAVLAIVAFSSTVKCRPALSPSPFGGDSVHGAGR